MGAAKWSSLARHAETVSQWRNQWGEAASILPPTGALLTQSQLPSGVVDLDSLETVASLHSLLELRGV